MSSSLKLTSHLSVSFSMRGATIGSPALGVLVLPFLTVRSRGMNGFGPGSLSSATSGALDHCAAALCVRTQHNIR
eukprot:18726-Heterococcus_DN1.PRE.1